MVRDRSPFIDSPFKAGAVFANVMKEDVYKRQDGGFCVVSVNVRENAAGRERIVFRAGCFCEGREWK